MVMPYHHHRMIHTTGKNRSICQHAAGRGIYNNTVIGFPQGCQHTFDPFLLQHILFCRCGFSARQDIQWRFTIGQDMLFGQLLSCQYVHSAECCFRQTQCLGNRWIAQVSVHQNDFFAFQGHGNSEIHGNRGFALAFLCTGNQDLGFFLFIGFLGDTVAHNTHAFTQHIPIVLAVQQDSGFGSITAFFHLDKWDVAQIGNAENGF